MRALQDTALFIIIEMGSAAASCSIRYSTVMKNKTSKDQVSSMGLFSMCPEHGCTDDHYAVGSSMQVRVATWGPSVPPEIPWAYSRSPLRHRAGQSAGHFLDESDMPLQCVIRNF